MNNQPETLIMSWTVELKGSVPPDANLTLLYRHVALALNQAVDEINDTLPKYPESDRYLQANFRLDFYNTKV